MVIIMNEFKSCVNVVLCMHISISMMLTKWLIIQDSVKQVIPIQEYKKVYYIHIVLFHYIQLLT